MTTRSIFCFCHFHSHRTMPSITTACQMSERPERHIGLVTNTDCMSNFMNQNIQDGSLLYIFGVPVPVSIHLKWSTKYCCQYPTCFGVGSPGYIAVFKSKMSLFFGRRWSLLTPNSSLVWAMSVSHLNHGSQTKLEAHTSISPRPGTLRYLTMSSGHR